MRRRRALLGKKMRSVVLLIVLVVSAAVAADESRREEFNRRSSVVSGLDRHYAKYLRVNKESGKEESAKVLEEFLQEFEENFDDADQWLLETISEEDGIVREVMTENKYHYTMTRAFLVSSARTIQIAAKVNYQYQVHSGNVSEGARIQHFMERARRESAAVAEVALGFIRETAWRFQFRADVDAFLQEHAGRQQLLNGLVAALQVKFPFRSWMALMLGRSHDVHVCLRPDAVNYESSALPGRRVLVAQVDADSAPFGSRGARILRDLPSSHRSWFKCPSAERVFGETGLSCRGGRFALAAVSEVQGEVPDLVAAASARLAKRAVRRSALLRRCGRHYGVMLFA